MSEKIDLQIELLQHYPWLPSLKELYHHIASKDPHLFISELFSEKADSIKQRFLKLFANAFENRESFDHFPINESNINFYLVLKILVYILNTDAITNRVANLYSKTMYKELSQENDYYLYQICQDLNLDVKYYQNSIQYRIRIIKDKKELSKTHFRIYFIDFLKLTSNLQDEYRKLVNNPISEGYIFILKQNLVRLLQEYVRGKILEIKGKEDQDITNLRETLLKIPHFKDLYEHIKNLWELKKEEFEYSIEIEFKDGERMDHIFPPCIIHILRQAQEGSNLTHTERLFLVFFLHSLKYPIKNIVDVFSTLPDFDREKTTYQVNFAKNKGYTPHSCETLKSLNLCKASEYSDELCLKGYYSKKHGEERKIKHPLFYVQYMHFKSSNKQYKNTAKPKKEKRDAKS
ncbi:MAG: DNA primase large subunit PriL [Promethearchaeota archaeon]|nr:MAG: DNA primase large subunit PriL [Candidatus Lokiarchaeota archaeon]